MFPTKSLEVEAKKVQKVEEHQVLEATKKDAKDLMLIYATDKAVAHPRQKLPESLRVFSNSHLVAWPLLILSELCTWRQFAVRTRARERAEPKSTITAKSQRMDW